MLILVVLSLIAGHEGKDGLRELLKGAVCLVPVGFNSYKI